MMRWWGIKKFERQNKTISVNVYGWAKKKKYIKPLKISDYAEGRKCHVDLLFLKNEEAQHHCWIKNFSGLMNRQATKNKRCLLYTSPSPRD